MNAAAAPRISVCVCTFRRPQLLGQLLDSLAAQTFPLNESEVVIVDNDAGGSARPVVEQAMKTHPALTLRYAVEPKPGVSHARNRGVTMASGELLAFIDDDEVACPGWLADLLETLEAHQADAAFGPVIPQYPPGSPDWIIRSGFFERPRHSTGFHIPAEEGRTGNALVRASRMRERQPEVFSTDLARSGGEDYDFFKWLAARGGKLVWCDSAEVCEEVPLDRQRLGFMMERCLRTATNYWRGAYAAHPTTWALRKALAGLIGGGGLLLLGILVLPLGRDRSLRAWSKGVKGLGRVAALSNIKLIGYGKDA